MGMSCLRSCGVGGRRTNGKGAIACFPGCERQGADFASNRPGRRPVGIAYISLAPYFLMDTSEGGIQERRTPYGRFAPWMDSVLDRVYQTRE